MLGKDESIAAGSALGGSNREVVPIGTGSDLVEKMTLRNLTAIALIASLGLGTLGAGRPSTGANAQESVAVLPIKSDILAAPTLRSLNDV